MAPFGGYPQPRGLRLFAPAMCGVRFQAPFDKLGMTSFTARPAFERMRAPACKAETIYGKCLQNPEAATPVLGKCRLVRDFVVQPEAAQSPEIWNAVLAA